MKKSILYFAAAGLVTAACIAILIIPGVGTTAAGACPRFEDKATFAGADSCKKCHFKQHSSWKKTTMATSFEKLKPDAVADVKKKFNLDPKKDYTKDAKCLECHTTGYGKEGGYPAVVEGKDWTEDEKKRAAMFENVQCESCHGPGSLTNVYKKDNEEYKKEEIMKRGMIEPNLKNCETCHNDKNPTYTKEKALDYEKAIKDPTKVHVHVELKKKH